MPQALSMSTLYKKLSKLGLSATYVRQAGLPSWWSDELNDQPAAVLEGAGHISKRLHLNLESLLKDDQEVKFKPLPTTKFKFHNQHQSDTPDVSAQLASRVAEVVAYAVQTTYIPIPEDINQIRTQILKRYRQISLESILDYCWQHGIAVVYFNGYPPSTRKITGMIQWQGNSPVIVLSSKRTYPAWLAFHLAHELAHLALGHVKEGILIDDEIEQDSKDQEEIDANRFAVQLLVGNLDNCFNGETVTSGDHLKNKIKKCLNSEPTVDPCALAFNFGWHHKEFKFAFSAAKKIGCPQNGDKIINHFLKNHLNWDNVSDDNMDHLEHILGD